MRDHLASMESLIEAEAVRRVDPTSLSIVIAIGLACVSSAGTAIEAIYGIDLDDTDQRARLVSEITDLLLYGVVPRPDGS